LPPAIALSFLDWPGDAMRRGSVREEGVAVAGHVPWGNGPYSIPNGARHPTIGWIGSLNGRGLRTPDFLSPLGSLRKSRWLGD